MELHRSSVSKDGLGPPRCANTFSGGIATNRFEPPCLACLAQVAVRRWAPDRHNVRGAT
jgi:hypothetical protein